MTKLLMRVVRDTTFKQKPTAAKNLEARDRANIEADRTFVLVQPPEPSPEGHYKVFIEGKLDNRVTWYVEKEDIECVGAVSDRDSSQALYAFEEGLIGIARYATVLKQKPLSTAELATTAQFPIPFGTQLSLIEEPEVAENNHLKIFLHKIWQPDTAKGQLSEGSPQGITTWFIYNSHLTVTYPNEEGLA
ncbi:hypothetical protein [Lusitaniella coriacea]|uniref:hypothetical protein n=1 Tax=Lusitaniella coriacea TaxID=1983105 RepID=UPI003CFAFD1E